MNWDSALYECTGDVILLDDVILEAVVELQITDGSFDLNGTRIDTDPNIASVAPDESADPLDIHFVRSLDANTWSDRIRINDDPQDTAWQWFGTMSVAPNGRIDAVWNDTRNDSTVTFSELYYAYSTDGGETWSANIPVSQPFSHYLGYPGGNNKLGDYYHMISDNTGANVAYAATFNGEQDIYFLRIPNTDCNANGNLDVLDVYDGLSEDCNQSGLPDECELGDYTGDGHIDLADHAALRACLTGPGGGPLVDCCALLDFDADAAIDLADFADLQTAFTGP